MFSLESRGDFRKTEKYLNKLLTVTDNFSFDRYGQMGVNALASATPRDSNTAAESWYYEVVQKAGKVELIWKNRNIENGFKVVIGIQYGHGTGTGGWVQGIDFINPALKPIFQKIADDLWKAVTSV